MGIYLCEREKKEGDRQTRVCHTRIHTRGWRWSPRRALCSSQRHWASILYTLSLGHMKTLLLSLSPHIFFRTPNCTQEVLRPLAVFVPGKGAQRNLVEDLPEFQDRAPSGMWLFPKLEPTPPQALKAPMREFPGKPWVLVTLLEHRCSCPRAWL